MEGGRKGKEKRFLFESVLRQREHKVGGGGEREYGTTAAINVLSCWRGMGIS